MSLVAPCPSLSQFAKREETRIIATPAGRDSSPSRAKYHPAFRQVSLTVCWYLFILLGPVVRKVVSTNPGLKVKLGVDFSCKKAYIMAKVFWGFILV